MGDLIMVSLPGRFALTMLQLSGLGFVYVMNEILHMLLFIELLRCHTPGVSSEPVMGSGYMSSCGNILQDCIIGYQHDR